MSYDDLFNSWLRHELLPPAYDELAPPPGTEEETDDEE